MRNVKLSSAIDVLTTVVALSTCAALLWTTTGRKRPRQVELPLPKEPLVLAGGPMDGSEQAPVAVVEYSDFQCPYCGKFARDVWPLVESAFVRTGRVRFAFRYFPLVQIHPHAQKAAEAAECAARQGKFWPMHDLLFKSQDNLDDAALVSDATSLDLASGAFRTCLSGAAAGKVEQDLELGKQWIRGTPTFLLGPVDGDGRVRITARLSGVQTFDAFAKALEALLKAPARTSS
jgi:protein-disulfide isomerase